MGSSLAISNTKFIRLFLSFVNIMPLRSFPEETTVEHFFVEQLERFL